MSLDAGFAASSKRSDGLADPRASGAVLFVGSAAPFAASRWHVRPIDYTRQLGLLCQPHLGRSAGHELDACSLQSTLQRSALRDGYRTIVINTFSSRDSRNGYLAVLRKLVPVPPEKVSSEPDLSTRDHSSLPARVRGRDETTDVRAWCKEGRRMRELNEPGSPDMRPSPDCLPGLYSCTGRRRRERSG
jgi:hypothetical protein